MTTEKTNLLNLTRQEMRHFWRILAKNLSEPIRL